MAFSVPKRTLGILISSCVYICLAISEAQAAPVDPNLKAAQNYWRALTKGVSLDPDSSENAGVYCSPFVFSAPDPTATTPRVAFPILRSRDNGQGVVMGATYGKGRVVAFGHEAFLYDTKLMTVPAFATLAVNAAQWVTNSSVLLPKRRPLVFAGNDGFRDPVPFLDWLKAQPKTSKLVKAYGNQSGKLRLAQFLQAQGKGVDVYMTDVYMTPTPEQATALAAWVAKGGALLVGGLAWSYTGYSKARDPSEFPGNNIYRQFGLTALPDVQKTGKGFITTPPSIVDIDVAPRKKDPSGVSQLEKLLKGNDLNALKSYATPLLRYLSGSRPTTGYAGASLAAYRTEVRGILTRLGEPTVSESSPVQMLLPNMKTVEDVKRAVLFAAATWLAMAEDPKDVRVSSNAATFPGLPGPASKVVDDVSVQCDTDTAKGGRRLVFTYGAPKWCGTGLYAGPGEVVTATVTGDAAAAVGAGLLSLQIGSWDDTLWADWIDGKAWKRAPQMVNTVDFKAAADGSARVQVASGFGGPVYVVVNDGASQGVVDVSVSGARRMARYVLGEHSAEDWAQMKAYDVPWFELESSKFIITAPTEPSLGVVQDPGALLAFYDKVVDAENTLAALDTDAPPRPQRCVLDIQPSVGYLHSGYPIMALWTRSAAGGDLATTLLSPNLFTNGFWGIFHELGHNHQGENFAGMTWDSVVEVTTNWFSRYVYESLLPNMNGGELDWSMYDAKGIASRLKKIKAWAQKAQPKNYDDVTQKNGDYETALDMYMLLQENFGWGLFKRMHRTYYDLPASQVPTDNDAKKQAWIWRTCEATGLNLVPYYDAWGLVATSDARSRCQALPTWTTNPLLNLDAYFAPGGNGTRPGPMD